MALGGVAFSMNIHAITPYMRAGALWGAGLLIVAYWTMPAYDSRQPFDLDSPKLASRPAAITVMSHTCWPSLAEKAAVLFTADTDSKPHLIWRGSLMSHGHAFVIQQDDGGHLFRKPFAVERVSSKASSKKIIGQTHDTAASQGYFGTLTDIQLCDSNDAVSNTNSSTLRT